MYLAGDIGGTKTNLALISKENGPRAPIAEATFPSRQYPSLEAVIQDFLNQTQTDAIAGAAFGVAGPVVNGQALATNLPWKIDAAQLAAALGFPKVTLINDLVSVATAIPALIAEELHTLQAGQPQPGGTIAVIAPGTGLGEGFLAWDGRRYRAYPSEGGHTDFAPTTPLESGLLRCLQGRFGHVSYERLCSGIGFPNIYTYLKDNRFEPEPAWLAEALAAAKDPTPVIFQAALDRQRPCELARTALQVFVSILGAEAGNLALKLLASGGVYLAGGIPPRILPVLGEGAFLKAFQEKGRLSALLASTPVHVILNPKAGLLGAALTAMEDG